MEAVGKPFCRCWAVVLLMLLVCRVQSSQAQLTGSCAPAEADAFLDANEVRARLFGNGPLFWRGSPNAYHVPKDDSISAIFAASIWIGGTVNGTVRTAGAHYNHYEFWPGPLDDQGHPPGDCARYDRLWELTSEDLAAYNATGIASANVRDWPWHLGAPVVDGDGNPDTYDLASGDRPALLGDQLFWWVMNDAGNEHESTQSPPIGVEIRGSAWSFDRRPTTLGYTTFYRYRIVYRGTAPLEDAYFGLWMDADLGNFSDDFIGSDTTLHLGYFYNADNLDENAYGENPPAVGVTFLQGALTDPDERDNDYDGEIDEADERAGMSSFFCGRKGFPPGNAIEYYNNLQGLKREGDPQYVGGNYWENDFSETPTRYCYPGDPVTGAFWSMENSDGAGTPIAPHDMRFLMSTGPFTMQPGDEQEIAFAIVWARGDDRLDSVRKLKEEVADIRQVSPSLLQPNLDLIIPSVPPAPVFPLGFAQNYPNPFRETTTIRYSVPQAMHIRLAVYDLLGREVVTLVNERQPPGSYEVAFEPDAALPAGLYLYRLELNHLRFTRRMMLVR